MADIEFLKPNKIKLSQQTRSLRLMGNAFEFTAITNDVDHSFECIDAGIREVQRIEKLLTTFNQHSVTNMINKEAGISPVIVPAEVFNLVERCLKISKITQGSFDISFGSVDKRFWNFDQTMTQLPDAKAAKEAVKFVDYRNIILNKAESSIFLAKKEMRIGFGGIGKGYAADRAKAVMVQAGSKSGVVNAAGDLTAWGNQADSLPWTIGVADPNKNSSLFSSFQINNSSVSTSGDYEKFVVIEGKKYAHTIDPNTGMPAQGIKSATVICSHAELADALTTPLMIMGPEAGLHMINQLNGIEAIIIDINDTIFTSKNINITK